MTRHCIVPGNSEFAVRIEEIDFKRETLFEVKVRGQVLELNARAMNELVHTFERRDVRRAIEEALRREGAR